MISLGGKWEKFEWIPIFKNQTFTPKKQRAVHLPCYLNLFIFNMLHSQRQNWWFSNITESDILNSKTKTSMCGCMVIRMNGEWTNDRKCHLTLKWSMLISMTHLTVIEEFNFSAVNGFENFGNWGWQLSRLASRMIPHQDVLSILLCIFRVRLSVPCHVNKAWRQKE